MFKRIIIFSCVLIFFNSCTTWAQEFSVSYLESYLSKSPDLNMEEDFFYPILYSGGSFLNISQSTAFDNFTDLDTVANECLSSTIMFPEASISQKVLEAQLNQIADGFAFTNKYHTYTINDLSNNLYNDDSLPKNLNLSSQEEIIKHTVSQYIHKKYSLDKKQGKSDKNLKNAINYITKLKADNIQVKNLKTKVWSYTVFPIVSTSYTVSVEKNNIYNNVLVQENYIVIPVFENDAFTYKIGYVFDFNKDFDKAKFENSIYCTDKVIDTTLGINIEYCLPNNISPLTYLELKASDKETKSKFLYLVNQSWDLSNQYCTQSNNYLEQSVFIGDSIFSGFGYYGLDFASQVLTKVGVGSRNIFELELQSNKVVYTIEQFIKNRNPKYVYIMLGLNDINMIDKLQYEENFNTIIKTIKKSKNETHIILCSMTPIRRLNYSSPEWIQSYNNVLQKIAKEEKNVYYIDLFNFMSKEGILANKYSAADGIHFTGFTYQMILDYFDVHQLKPILEDIENFKISDLEQIKLIVDKEKITYIIDCEKNKGPAIPFSKPKKTPIQI